MFYKNNIYIYLSIKNPIHINSLKHTKNRRYIIILNSILWLKCLPFFSYEFTKTVDLTSVNIKTK